MFSRRLVAHGGGAAQPRRPAPEGLYCAAAADYNRRRPEVGNGTSERPDGGQRQTMTENIPAPPGLASIDLLSGVPADTMAQIEAGCRRRDCRAGETIIERGATDQDVYFVLTGLVHVMNFAPSGRIVAFAALQAGNLFGELAALDGQPRSATVVAATECTFAVMPAAEFRRLVTTDPEIALTLMQRMAQIVRAGDERIFNLSALGATQRVCLELLRLSEPDPAATDLWVVYPVPTHAALAATVGTARETVVRMFRRLTSAGIVERKAKSLYIRDRKRLEAQALLNEAENNEAEA